MKYMTSRYPNPRDDAFMTDDIGTVDDVDDGQWLVGGRVYDNKRWKDDLQQRFVVNMFNTNFTSFNTSVRPAWIKQRKLKRKIK